MRVVGIPLSISFAVLLSAFGAYSYDKPLKQQGISFSVPYRCGKEEADKPTHTEKVCLADSFDKELNVVLVSKIGKCRMKTSGTFKEKNPLSHFEFEATHLTRTENCLAEEDQERFCIAVIGVDDSAVKVIKPETDKSSLSKDIELKARKIASSAYQKLSEYGWDASDSLPDVFRVGNTAFLLFQCTDDFPNQDGLPVLILNNDAFRLNGSCAFRSPFFFSVYEKLYVSYWATVECCGCGDRRFFVYDVSGESPKLVYENDDFSD